MKPINVVIAATHPIQYHSPWFRELSKVSHLNVTVLFGMMPSARQQSVGFDTDFSWDIPLTDGFQWQVLENVSEQPNLSNFKGIDCPSIGGHLNDLKPDFLIITGWQSKYLLQATYAAWRHGIKMIVRGESNAKKSRPLSVRLLHRLLLGRFSAFLAIGSSNRQFYLDNGVHPEKIFSAPYFVENKRFMSISDDSSANSLLAKIPSDHFCFIYSGKLIEKKNVIELLVAYAELSQKTDKIHLVIVGDGALRASLESYAEQYRLSITFCGFVNQSVIPSLYAVADCFLLASDYDETWGLVVNEAMVSGLPAIVSNRAGSSEDLVIEAQTGYVYPYGDTAALSAKMALVCNQPERSKQMGINAKQHVLKHFNVEKTVDATCQAIDYLTDTL